MIIVIKSEHRFAYPSVWRDKQLQYVNSTYHPTYGTWIILATTPNGEFVSVKREHVTRLTKLEAALE